MQFLVIVTAFVASLASAADICRATGSGCSGTLVCCNGIQENNCCNFNGAFPSIRFTLPANSRGQSFTGNSCTSTSTTFGNPDARTVCHIPANNSGRSARWLTGQFTPRVKRDEESYLQKCAEPNMIIYERDGVEKRVPIPEDMTADAVMEALEAETLEIV